MSEKLKPCPFCGGKATIEQDSKNGYKIKCTNCVVGKKQRVIRNSMEWLRWKMIEDWNTRAEEYRLSEAIKLLDQTIVEMNPVTCYHRHGVEIPKEKLDNLSNWQLEIEAFLNKRAQ